MITSPSRVQRLEDIDAKDAQGNHLIVEIIPMLDGLDTQGLRELQAYLESRIQTAKKDASSGKIVTKGSPLERL